MTEIEKQIYESVDQIKELFSAQLWESILLDCSKNEIFIMWLLYRQEQVNMSQIAEYIHVPLNTATGIVARMEKKELVVRERSAEDKRVVTVRLGEKGNAHLSAMIKECTYYGSRIMTELSAEELRLLSQMISKLMCILQEEKKSENEKKKVRKITIE